MCDEATENTAGNRVNAAHCDGHFRWHGCGGAIGEATRYGLQTERQYAKEFFFDGADITDIGIADWRAITKAHGERTRVELRQKKLDGLDNILNISRIESGLVKVNKQALSLGVIIKEALANGRLTDRASGPEPLRRDAGRLGVSVDQLALAGALSQPWADVVLSGAVTPAELESNLGALGLAVDDAESLAGVAEDPTVYWSNRADLPWS